MIFYIPLTLPSNLLIDKNYIKISIWIAVGFNILGCWTRLFINQSFAFVHLGQIFFSISQPFSLNAVTKISYIWFKEENRAVATTIAASSMLVGNMLSMIYPSFYFEENSSETQFKHNMYNYLLSQAIIGTIFCFPSLIFFKEKPNTSLNYDYLQINPNQNNNEQSNNFKKDLKKLFLDLNFIVLLLLYCFSIGSYNCFGAINEKNMDNYGISFKKSNWFVTIYIIAGLLGSLLFSFIVDRTKAFKKVHLFGNTVGFICQLLITILLEQNYDSDKFIYLYYAIFFIYGFNVLPIFGLCLDFASEITFPVGESLSCGIMQIVSQISGIVLVEICNCFLDNEKLKFIPNCIVTLSLGFAVFFNYIVKEKLKRAELEKEKKLYAK